MNTFEEIKNAVDNGYTVCCGSDIYQVILSGNNDYLVKCILNGYCQGLMHLDGVNSEFEPSDFYIDQSEGNLGYEPDDNYDYDKYY